MAYPYDGSALPYPKTDKAPLPLTESPTNNIQASDWNAFGAALDGIRNAITGAARPSASGVGLAEAALKAINIEDKGAVSGTVSDAQAALNLAAIQAAFDAQANGGKVIIPPKRYRIPDSSVLVASAYSGNGGNIRSLHIDGGANAGMDDIQGASNFGATVFKTNAAADSPILALNSTRGVKIRGVNFVSNAYGTSGSVAVHIKDSNSNLTVEHCTFQGFYEGVRIGNNAGPYNNDDTVWIEHCVFGNVHRAIRNLSTESYQLVVEKCEISADVIYRTEGSSGTVMNALKMARCQVAPGSVFMEHVTGGSAHNSRDITVIQDCLIETAGTGGVKLLTMDSTAANNGFGFVFERNTYNAGDSPDYYAPGWYWIEYHGRGPFIIEKNRFVGNTRCPIYLNTVAATVQSVALSISYNDWQYKPVILRPPGAALSELKRQGEWIETEPRQNYGDSDQPNSELPTAEMEIASRKDWLTAPIYGQTWLEGSRFTVGGTGSDPVTVGLVRQRGTWGSLTGVQATATNGQSTITLTAGSALMKARVQAGRYIYIGTGSAQEVLDVIGNTVYLATAFGGVTGTGLAVDFYNPIFYQEAWGYTAAPVGANSFAVVPWNKGDRVWNLAPADAGAPGSEYTVEGWVNIGFSNTWRERRALTGN